MCSKKFPSNDNLPRKNPLQEAVERIKERFRQMGITVVERGTIQTSRACMTFVPRRRIQRESKKEDNIFNSSLNNSESESIEPSSLKKSS